MGSTVLAECSIASLMFFCLQSKLDENNGLSLAVANLLSPRSMRPFPFTTLMFLCSFCAIAGVQDQTSAPGDMAKPTLAMPAEIAKDCPFTYLVPPIFMKGNGMVGGDGEAPTGCSVITYYLTNQNLSPDDATKTIEFHDYKKGLEQVLKTKLDGYVSRGESGEIQLSDDAEFTTCGDKIARHDTTEIAGPNWHGWIIESEFGEPKDKHVVSGCSEYNPTYRCINMAIGNDKMSAILKPRCFLRKPGDSLHTELSYDAFIAVVKTIRFKEGG